MNKNDLQVSNLPTQWGGPFVWLRNEAGNLVLTKVSALVDDAKEALEALKGGRR